MDESEIILQGSQFVVGIGTLALINAGLAQCKNKRGLVWFIISLAAGPLATLLLVIMDKQPEKKE